MINKKIAWITDSTAFITQDLKDNPDVFVIPLEIIFSDKAFEDNVDLTTEDLYYRIKNDKEIPKTSQPSVGKFVELFEKLKEDYDSAIAVHISEQLSGTLASCNTAAEIAQFPIEIVDSKSMSYAITSLIYKGMEMSYKGHGYIEIAEMLRNEASKSENYILLGSLEQFYKGGRMSGTQYLLGSLLHIKPIIRINHLGEFELFEKIRSEKKAIKRMIELLNQKYKKYKISQVQIMHGNVPTKALELKQSIKNLMPHLDIFIGEISSTIAVHAGEGTLAIIWNNED